MVPARGDQMAAPRSTSVLAIDESSVVRMSGPNFKDKEGLITQSPKAWRVSAEKSLRALCAAGQ